MCISCACSSWVVKRSEAVICFGQMTKQVLLAGTLHKVQLQYNIGYPTTPISFIDQWPLGMDKSTVCLYSNHINDNGWNTLKTQERPWASKVGKVDHRILSLTIAFILITVTYN